MSATWKIIACDGKKKVGSLSNVVTTIQYEVTDSEGTAPNIYYGRSIGVVSLAEPDSKSFIALSSITNSNLIAWTKAALGHEEVTKIETSVAAQITEAKTPTVFSGFVPSS
tara:strand:+ start:69 stop:401 length:333 start_codon:yes stop_codon:yes gene_type:complete